MTPKTHKIETAAGTVTTRTARRFIVVAVRERAFYTARVDRIEVARGHYRADVEARAAAEARVRGIEGDVEVFAFVPFARVEKRTDSFATAKREAAKVVGGFVFDTATGERA